MVSRPFDLEAGIAARVPPGEADTALLLSAITQLGRVLDVDLATEARAIGLERSESEVLATLWLAGPDHPLTPSQLSTDIAQTRSGMTKTLRRLEAAGYIRRLPHPTDGRGQLVRLTPKGTRLIAGYSRQLYEIWDARLQCLPATKRAAFAEALTTLLGSLTS